jgi:hypothetical protein
VPHRPQPHRRPAGCPGRGPQPRPCLRAPIRLSILAGLRRRRGGQKWASYQSVKRVYTVNPVYRPKELRQFSFEPKNELNYLEPCSEHAVLHDLESLPLSSDLKTFGQILKRLSRPTETMKNLPILASEKVCKHPTNVTSYLGQ